MTMKDLNSNALVKFRQKYIGYIPQDYGLIDDWSVYDNVSFPLMMNPNSKQRTENLIG